MSKKNALNTEWNLKLLYGGDKDAAIEGDVARAAELADVFEKRYRDDKRWLEDEDALLEALAAYEKLSDEAVSERPIMYYYYRRDLDSSDKKAEAAFNRLVMRVTEIENKLLFFSVNLRKIPAELQEKFLASGKLAKYRYFLKVAFDDAKHVLSEPEERILNLKSLPASTMWVNATEKVLNRQTVKHKGKDVPVAEALALIPSLPTAPRRKLHDASMAKLREVSDMAEAEINAVYTNKMINDKLRGYAEPYDATILGYENDRDTVMRLIETATRRFDVSRKFYNLKKRLLGLPSLEYADRSASIGATEKKIPFEEAHETIRSVFDGADPEFSAILDRFMENGQVDVFPRKGKTGGAYCSGSHGNPTFVLLNHVPNFKSVMTFAHEMGHAIHTEFSKRQPVVYEHYTISAAEVASTLFESIVFDAVFEKLPEKDKIVALHDRLNDGIATVFRQIACFNYELELHRRIRENGALQKEEMADILNKHMKAYIGPAMKLKEDDGYFFVNWSHIRRHFYVYSYAYGELISKALYRKYKADPAYMGEIKKFLSAGGSMSPDDIFASIGIDTRSPSFWEEGIAAIEEDIARLDKLTKRK